MKDLLHTRASVRSISLQTNTSSIEDIHILLYGPTNALGAKVGEDRGQTCIKSSVRGRVDSRRCNALQILTNFIQNPYQTNTREEHHEQTTKKLEVAAKKPTLIRVYT